MATATVTGDRMVSMSAAHAHVLEEVVIPTLLRSRDEQGASKMMELALAWKFAPPKSDRPDRLDDELARLRQVVRTDDTTLTLIHGGRDDG
ncbi:MAG TPA: hypothetical protein VMK83_00375 [Gaiellaceae bacterium]|nr:hypothetical protein [Gaiellaceae bacterium]